MATELNEIQRAAVAHREGPALVLAGPGSGKTTVITRRSLALAGELSSPRRLLSVTFTRAAGEEMAARYCALAGIAQTEKAEIPVFRTVHAFCNGVIGMYEKESCRHFTRIEGEHGGKEKIIAGIYRAVCGRTPDASLLEQLCAFVQRAGAAGGNTEAGERQIRHFTRIYEAYVAYKRERGLLDFDDMIDLCLELMRADPAFCRAVSAQFDFVQVDEAQDLSRAQYEVLQLVGAHGNLFVVGDDDQSIYGFRGADPSCLLDFAKAHPDCKRYDMTQNYRSGARIVAAASAVIGHNRQRFDKKLFTAREPGAPVRVRRFVSGADQCRFACDVLRESGKTGAILYRNAVSALSVRLLLTSRATAYRIRGGWERPWDIPVVRDVMRRIAAAERRARFLLPRPSSVFRGLLRDGFLEEMRAEFERNREQKRFLASVLEFLSLLTGLCDSYGACVRLLDRMQEMDEAASAGSEPCPVTLSTVHSAKGLEFDTVCMIDLLEGEFPGSGAGSGSELEEERRLFYVGMTRAENALYLCYPERRGMQEETASRFVSEIRAEKAGRNRVGLEVG